MRRTATALILWVGAALAQQAPPTVNSLAWDIERVESVREIKDVQRNFAQFAQFGRWDDMAALFSETGTLRWGDESSTGIPNIAEYLGRDAGKMDGITPGSLDTLVAETPVINLAADGLSAKGRWNGLRFMGDGAGGSRIQGGIYTIEYVFVGDQWKISLLHYYQLYAGPYEGGWRNYRDSGIPLVPYDFTPDTAGVPIPPSQSNASFSNTTAGQLAHRVTRLNDEDEVRNLQHSYGYYVDRRMWDDVVDLFTPNATVKIAGGNATYMGASGVRKAMVDRMGPQGLTTGILNDHPLLDTIVQVDPNGKEAIARGIEIGMIGNVNASTASWEFSAFRNRFVKDDGLWKLSELHLAPLISANYSEGWGNGGEPLGPSVSGSSVPAFLDVGARTARSRTLSSEGKNINLADVRRRLARSAAVDGAENVSNAYGYLLDDRQCSGIGTLHANDGHKLSPFAGYYRTPGRISEACRTVYASNSTNTTRLSLRSHWRPQPVAIASQDGRSVAFRARLLQPVTSNKGGGFNGAMYHDQMVLENGRWKLWSVTIDEHYWLTTSWEDGWIKPNQTVPDQSKLLTKLPPDLTLKDVGDRESTFFGGSGDPISWPEIQRMWFAYRNPVSGRVPQYYWPGCVPCVAKPDWALLENEYQEPPTGPTLVAATATEGGVAPVMVTIVVRGGPDEPVDGIIEVHGDKLSISAGLEGGKVMFPLSGDLAPGSHSLVVSYLGSDRLAPGQTTITVKVNEQE